MNKTNILLGVLILLVISQFGLIFYLDNVVGDLDRDFKSLEEELGITQEELDSKIQDTQKDVSKLTADVIKTQEDLEEQSDELSELKASASDDFSGIIEDTIDSVVSVLTDVSQGSGFIITDEGYIVTNYHVIEDSNSISIKPYQKSTRSAELVGYDSKKDVALLKITGTHDSIDFGDSNDAEVGEKVIAMGNPFGLSFSVTEGIISSLDRSGPAGEESYIQTDVPLNPGNSGGPLINKQGEVIGINNFKIGGAESLGFSLKSNAAVNIINDIAQIELGEDLI